MENNTLLIKLRHPYKGGWAGSVLMSDRFILGARMFLICASCSKAKREVKLETPERRALRIAETIPSPPTAEHSQQQRVALLPALATQSTLWICA